MLGHPLLSPQPGAPVTLFCGDRIKSLLFLSSSCVLSYIFGKARGEGNILPSFIRGLSCRGAAEVTQAVCRSHRCPPVPLGQLSHHIPALTQVAPQAGAPWPPLTHRSQCSQSSLSNPLGALEPAGHKPLRNYLRMIFRPPQRTVKKLWLLAYMNVAKLSLNQRQRLKIFLQAKSLPFSQSPSKDQKLQLLNLIHTE